MFLHLRHIESSELGRGSTLGEQTNRGPLSEPLGQPGQVTVTVQIVGVETAVKKKKKKKEKRKEINMDAFKGPLNHQQLKTQIVLKVSIFFPELITSNHCGETH